MTEPTTTGEPNVEPIQYPVSLALLNEDPSHPDTNPNELPGWQMTPTPYTDEDDASPRSAGYLLAQAAFMECSASADHSKILEPGEAADFTRLVSQGNGRRPGSFRDAGEVIRLCYYMRSLGGQTYALLNPEARKLTLWITHPEADRQRTSRDVNYWMQTWEQRQIAGCARGDNAVVPDTDFEFLEADVTFASVDRSRTRRWVITEIPRSGDVRSEHEEGI